MPFADQEQTERLDKGGLANTRHTTDADTERIAASREQACQQLIGLSPMIGTGRFEQRDGLGHGPALHRRVTINN
jgi:hypothetical protein